MNRNEYEGLCDWDKDGLKNMGWPENETENISNYCAGISKPKSKELCTAQPDEEIKNELVPRITKETK